MDGTTPKELGGQRALVTGGGRGIGRAIARALAAQGAAVAVVARTRAQVEAVAAELAAGGARSLALAADVAEEDCVESALAAVDQAWGGVDILVNNAGALGPIGPAHDVDPRAWLDAVRVNLGGCFLCCRAALPGMIARGHGRIINLSGGGAVSPRPWFSAYGAAKAAVARFTETLAAEVAGRGIQVNAIAPGAVNTAMTQLTADVGGLAAAEAAAARRQLDEGGVPPERAAALAVYLASPRSAGLTGRLLSAVWDDWEHLDVAAVMASDAYTVRRLKP